MQRMRDRRKITMKSLIKSSKMKEKQTKIKYSQIFNGVPLFRAKSRGVVGVPTNGDIPGRTSYLYRIILNFK